MPKIINLSACHTLRPISYGITAFARLCNKYAPKSCFNSCPSFFNKLSNKAWVMYLYQRNLSTLINPYKLGKITTAQFLNGLLRLFNFLDSDTLIFDKADRDRIESTRHRFMSTKEVPQTQPLTNRHIALALLEEAWNEVVGFTDYDASKMEYLLQQSKDTPIYFISNTNELNVHKIMSALKEALPRVQWRDVSLAVEENASEFIEIAPNLFLCLSYRVHSFKTAPETQAQKITTTPSLLRYLVGKLDTDVSQIEVISQFGKDLEEAAKLNIPKENLTTAQKYFLPAQIREATHMKNM